MSNEREMALVRRVCRQYGATGNVPSDVEIDALIADFNRFDAPAPAPDVDAREQALVEEAHGCGWTAKKGGLVDETTVRRIIAAVDVTHPRARLYTPAQLRDAMKEAASEGAQLAKAACIANDGEWPLEDCDTCNGAGKDGDDYDCEECAGTGQERAPASPMSDALDVDALIARMFAVSP
jgi:hypothetical protein